VGPLFVLNNPTNLTDPTGYSWTEYIPVYGSIESYSDAMGEGHFGAAAAYGGMAIFDGATLGIGSIVDAPLKAMLKAGIQAEIKHEAEMTLAKEAAAQAAHASEKASEQAAKQVEKAQAEAEAQAATDAGEAGNAAGRVDAKNQYKSGGKFSKKTKAESAERADNTCEYCGQETVPAKKSEKGVTPPGNEGQTDHIEPRSKGGDNSPENAAHACRDCNRKMSDSDKPNPRAKDQPPPPEPEPKPEK